jgi:N-acetylmuramoyl-L-alanine amidase
MMLMSYSITNYHGNYNITRRSSTIKYIVVHYTAGTGSAKNNCIYFSNGNRNASAHYFIDDNSIYEYADPKAYATWHCGDGNGKYGITNQNSIGIEVVNTGGAFSKAEIDRLAWLVQKLMKQFNIPAANVVRHYDASRKQCPLYYVKNGSAWTNLHAQITGGKVTGNAVPASMKPTSSSTLGGMTVNITLNVLQQGSSGNQVRTLQRLLKSLGYSVGSAGVDGSFGPATKNAVLKFQAAKKIDVDGSVGPQTWNALLK